MQTKSDTFFAYANKFRLYPIVIGSLYFDLSLFLQGRVLLVGLFVRLFFAGISIFQFRASQL